MTDRKCFLTLRASGRIAEAVTETVLRRDIATQISGSGLSLMPEGLEAAISIEQMAGLIAFLLLPPQLHSNEDHRHRQQTRN